MMPVFPDAPRRERGLPSHGFAYSRLRNRITYHIQTRRLGLCPRAAQSVSYVKAHFAQVINRVREGGGPIIVTQNGASAAIIQDPETYERMRYRPC